MMMYLLYWGLLVAWVLLLWPAFRLKGPARVWLLVVVAAGIVALVYETYMYLWSFADIRLDILLISMALGCLYGSAVALLLWKSWWRAATVLAIALIVIGGGMISKWVEVGREGQRVDAAVRESSVLLFKAKFGSTKAYESYFGPFSGAAGGHPTGHWQVAGQSHFTRMIINAEGRVWLFYKCYESAECHSGPGGSGLRESPDDQLQWQASLEPQAGLPFEIKIVPKDSVTLSVKVRELSLRFTKAPPPVDPAPAPQLLTFTGSFSHLECSGVYARVRQVWLWEEAARQYAVGIFSTLVAGRQHDFVRPIVMGEGVREGDGWRFAWQRDGRSGTALIVPKVGDVILTLDQDLDRGGRNLEDADQLTLNSDAVFSDERIDLAPLTSGADWQHWFDNVLVGHFTSGNVPAC